MDFNRNDNISLINLSKKYNIDNNKYTDIKLIKKIFLPVYKEYISNSKC
jgi:hypothetical protein